MAADRLLETLTLRKNGPNIGPNGIGDATSSDTYVALQHSVRRMKLMGFGPTTLCVQGTSRY